MPKRERGCSACARPEVTSPAYEVLSSTREVVWPAHGMSKLLEALVPNKAFTSTTSCETICGRTDDSVHNI